MVSPQARQPAVLPDDLLEEIFLRITSPTDLARASTACISFRRLITDRTFLRRYRFLHPPLFLGFVNHSGFVPVQAPHPNAPAGNALGHAARAGFSFNEYLPTCRSDRQWRLLDARDGRVLLNYRPPQCSPVVIFPELAVCDPLHRTHQLLPPMPEELLAGVQVQGQRAGMFMTCLAPSRYEDDETLFRVIGIAYRRQQLKVFVFSSVSCCWNIGIISTSWGDLGFNSPQGIISFHKPDRAYGCLYWNLFDKVKRLLKLDIDRMEFSSIDLPRDRSFDFAVVEAGEGRLGLFSHSYEDTYVDYHTIMQNGSDDAGRWQMVKRIPVPNTPSPLRCHFIIGVSEEYILLVGSQLTSRLVVDLSINVKTFKFEMVSSSLQTSSYFFRPYIGYPLFMSPRRI